MRLGLLGGSFNPIHRCHLSIAHSAQMLLELDRVLFVPTGDPPHKPPGTLATATPLSHGRAGRSGHTGIRPH